MTELLEATITYEYQGQACISRWNYITDATPAAATLSLGLAGALGALPSAGVYPVNTVLNALRAILHNEVRFVDIEIFNQYVPTDFYNTPFLQGTTGNRSGVPASPVLSFGFRSNRSRRDVGRGYKRFPGVEEEAMLDGGMIDPAVIAQMENLATKMGQTIDYDDEGNILSYTPCIVAKESYPTSSGRTAYKYYEDKAVQLQNVATSILWEPYNQVRTQVSRQYGRGV